MLYILCCIFSFIIGWKFAKVWNLLQISYFKKQIDNINNEEKYEKKYKDIIKEYEFKNRRLINIIKERNEMLEDFREYSKEDFEEV